MKSYLFKNRKGQILNYIVIIIFLFSFALVSMFGMLILSEWINAFNSSGFSNSATDAVSTYYMNAFKTIDWIMVIMLVGLLIGLGLTTYKLKTSAAFLIVSVIACTFMGFVGFFFSYMFQRIVGEAVFSSIIIYFPRTILICTNLHWVALVAFILGSITLYAKNEQGGYVGE